MDRNRFFCEKLAFKHSSAINSLSEQITNIMMKRPDPNSTKVKGLAKIASLRLPMFCLLVLEMNLLLSPLLAQQVQADAYPVGNPLGLPVNPVGGDFSPMTSNVKVYGAIHSAESCSYDPDRDLLVVVNRGVSQSMQPNDAFVSLINHDGSVHTLRWIGLQQPKDRNSLTPPLVLNDPLGSDIVNGMLYICDREDGPGEDDPSRAVIHQFDMKTGAPVKSITLKDSPWINDIAVTEDGMMYTTQTGDMGSNPDPQSWRVWKISPEGDISVFAVGGPLHQPNGIAFDPEGNIVVVNYGNTSVLTYSREGELLNTEASTQPGGDGLVITPDGTKYVCSVREGGVFRIRPGESAELIAENIPSAASMCYDPTANQLVIPMTAYSGLAFIKLE